MIVSEHFFTTRRFWQMMIIVFNSSVFFWRTREMETFLLNEHNSKDILGLVLE